MSLITQCSNFFVLFFATGLGSGLIPGLPGTYGSLVGLGIVFLLRPFSFFSLELFTGAIIPFSMIVSHQAAKIFHQADPGKIVIDEIAGLWVTLLFLPRNFSWKAGLIAFLLFRVFDIAKPFPIRLLDQKVKGGIGIVADDLLAGVFAGLLYLLLTRVFHFTF